MNLTVTEIERAAYVSGTTIPDALMSAAVVGQQFMDATYGDIFGDIAAGFPAEDCLSEPITDLRNVIKGMRKSEARTALEGLMALLEEKQSELSRSGEYGAEELKKARDAINGIGGQ